MNLYLNKYKKYIILKLNATIKKLIKHKILLIKGFLNYT